MATMVTLPDTLAGKAGLGFRRDLVEQLASQDISTIDFFEVSPENWMGMGGRYRDTLQAFRAQKPFVAHGLSLSLGSSAPLDTAHLARVKSFLTEYNIELFTEHLSWCSDSSHLYDLLPIPLNAESVKWVAARIRQTQDILQQRIGVENASVYFTPEGSELSEPEFVAAVVQEADCYLHLDVNNIYVNSQNFGFDATEYVRKLPLDKTCYIHVAGHFTEDDGLIIDTHGSAVIDPVWELLELAYSLEPVLATHIPTCLERDFNFPKLDELVAEVGHIRTLQQQAATHSKNTSCQPALAIAG